MDVKGAQALADRLALDGRIDETQRGRRIRAYARGREDASRMPLGERDRRIARYLALAGYYNDQHRAYWLGVIREARS